MLSTEDLPAGSSVVECDAVGRAIGTAQASVVIPVPGEGVLLLGGGANFAVDVSPDGIISYPDPGTPHAPVSGGVPDVANSPYDRYDDGPDPEVPNIDEPAPIPDVVPESPESSAEPERAPFGCRDYAYELFDYIEKGTYLWYVGDGPMPAGLSRPAAKDAFAYGLVGMTDGRNDCGENTSYDARRAYQGFTTYEADISSGSRCTERDGRSTWDAGDLTADFLAATCAWRGPASTSGNRDLLEADVRFNIQNHNFVNRVTSSCSRAFDLRSIATHEAGHVFGLNDVRGDHEALTMFGRSQFCTTFRRTLGRGDMLGMARRY